jgi:hypothetical protein
MNLYRQRPHAHSCRKARSQGAADSSNRATRTVDSSSRLTTERRWFRCRPAFLANETVNIPREICLIGVKNLATLLREPHQTQDNAGNGPRNPVQKWERTNESMNSAGARP